MDVAKPTPVAVGAVAVGGVAGGTAADVCCAVLLGMRRTAALATPERAAERGHLAPPKAMACFDPNTAPNSTDPLIRQQ
jgi:hypothetical protein